MLLIYSFLIYKLKNNKLLIISFSIIDISKKSYIKIVIIFIEKSIVSILSNFFWIINFLKNCSYFSFKSIVVDNILQIYLLSNYE